MKSLPGKSTSLGKTLEVLKLPFNTHVLVNSDVCFIEGKQTLLDTLVVNPDTSRERICIREEWINVFTHVKWLYFSVLTVFFAVHNGFLPVTGSRMACEVV